MKNLFTLIVILTGFTVLLNAQVSDNYTLTQNDLIFLKDGEYDLLTTEDQSFTEEIGNPQLPVKIVSYVLPYNSTVAGITINSVTQQKQDDSYYIYPTQPPRPLDGSEPPPFVEPNQAIYGSSTPYPNKTVEIISDGYTHGYHVVTVAIYPVVYHPADREIYFRNINFTIDYTGSFDNNLGIPFEVQSARRAKLGKQFIENFVKNTSDIENFRNNNVQLIDYSNSGNIIDSTRQREVPYSAIDVLVPEYIIITNNALKPTFQQLADWKTKKGVPAIIKTIEEIEPNYHGSDVQEKIRNYLIEAYTKYGASLFVLLGGDVNIVPGRLFSHSIFATDLYYASVNGTWNANNNDKFGEYGDINTDYNYAFFLGRASVENVIESQTFVNKVITYEKYSNLGNSTYVNNYLCLGGFLTVEECKVFYDGYYDQHKNIANTYMPANTNKWFVFDNHDCQYNSSDPFQTPFAYQPYVYGTCYNYTSQVLPGGGPCITGNQKLNKVNAISCLNNGASSFGKFHLVYHLQHSGVKGMGISRVEGSSFINSDFDNLTNGNYHQILFSNGCGPASFNFDCIGEHYIKNPNGGGIAFIGNSDVGYYGEHVQFQRFCQALYGNSYNLGSAFQNAPGTNSDAKRRLTLLGDPETPVWTDTPQPLPVQILTISAPNANGEVAISVALGPNFPQNKTATICIQKGDECYLVDEISSNQSYIFEISPHTSGAVSVTITAQNYIPYEYSSNISITKNIYISNLTFVDGETPNSIGNADGQLDAGETVELTVQLKNVATTPFANVTAVLTCNSPYIKILNNISNFGIINAGTTKNSPTLYVFKIDSLAPEVLLNEMNQIKFTLQITAWNINGQTSTYTDKFNIEIFNQKIELGNKTIVSGNIAPGATITMNIDLFNKGRATATELKAVLSSNSQYITNCSTVPRDYPPIGKFETKTNSSVYQFSISPSYTSRQPLNFKLLVTNQYGKTWNFAFNLLDRPAPVANSTINFISDRTSIKLFWTPIQPLASIQGYNIYRSDADANGNEVGNYVKVNSIIFPAAFYNDTGLEELTKYWYKVSAVSSTGNESALSTPFLAWTSYPFMDGFPVEMEASVGKNIKSGVNVADVNNDGKKEIFTCITKNSEEAFIIGLKSDGTELFDIDGNPTSFSGFAKIDGEIEGTPAIGDLSANGVQKIISITRKINQQGNALYCHSSQDGNNDGKPDMLWTTGSGQSYRSPIIANLDNNPNGFLKSIFFSEYGGIKIYNHDGILEHNIANVGTAYGAIAVADIDEDSKKEIIGCYSTNSPAVSGIYIWKDNGSAYGSQPFYSLSNYDFKSSVIVCDLDNDGVKEILTIAYNQSFGRVIAIKPNGTLVSGWNNPNNSQTLTIANNWHTVEIAVGDLDNDGKLDVVVFGNNGIYIWNNSGILINFIPLPLGDNGKRSPILADFDGDPEIEILVSYRNLIDAYKMNGSRVLGFPLQVEEEIGNSCVDDIDNDGKNELIAASGTKIYAWKINGTPDCIEWGCERANAQNTGEYSKAPCTDIIINNTVTWTTPHKSCGNIIIQSGATLTIKNTVLYMGDHRSITVKPGAKLVVDGGKITNATPNKLWLSIYLSGNYHLSQNTQNQGTLELKNGAVIENAYNAIATYELTPNGDIDWTTTGGIIQASNTTFYNNCRSVEYMSYCPTNGRQMVQNLGRFTNCSFIIDDNNIVASSNANILNQFTMWDVTGVQIKGCTFENNITNMPDRKIAIYTADAGYTVDEACNLIDACECGSTPNRSIFGGFKNAIESTYSGKQYALKIDRSNFRNNIIGVRINGKNSFQVSRLRMYFSPIQSPILTGIYLDNCTGYKVEDNTIYFLTNIASSFGILVINAGENENVIYRNAIVGAHYGITVTNERLMQTNPNIQRSQLLTGLQFVCNNFSSNYHDIYVGRGGQVRYLQGALNVGADNPFLTPITTYNFYLNAQHTPIIYHHSSGLEPVNRTNNVALLNATTNICGSTLCNYFGAEPAVLTEGFSKGSSYLDKYRYANKIYDEMTYTFYKKGYDKILGNFFDEKIEIEEVPKEVLAYVETMSSISEYMAELSNENLFTLKTDSIIDLIQIRDWYDAINTKSAKYSLAETYYQLGQFEEGFHTLALIPKMYDLNEDEMIEHNNYVSLFTFKNKIREDKRNIAQLNDAEIEQMIYFAEASPGLSSAMARGILCFFYEICLDINDEKPNDKGEEDGKNENRDMGVLSNKVSNATLENIALYPNPTTGELIIMSGELQVSKIEVFDIVGKIVSSHHFITSESHQKINISTLNSGIYFIKVVTEQGEVVKKVVKQ